MSSKKDDGTAGAVGGLIMMALIGIAIAFAAVLLFITVVLTIACLMAWNRPVKFMGHDINPEDARSFIKRGLAGAYLLPLATIIAAMIWQFNLTWDALGILCLVGYVTGSLGVEYLFGDHQAAAAPPPPAPPQQQYIPPAVQPRLPARREPFQFASWDDEEER